MDVKNLPKKPSKGISRKGSATVAKLKAAEARAKTMGVSVCPNPLDHVLVATGAFAAGATVAGLQPAPTRPGLHMHIVTPTRNHRVFVCPLDGMSNEIDMHLAAISTLLSEQIIVNVVQAAYQAKSETDVDGAIRYIQGEVFQEIAKGLIEACRKKSNYVAI